MTEALSSVLKTLFYVECVKPIYSQMGPAIHSFVYLYKSKNYYLEIYKSVPFEHFELL